MKVSEKRMIFRQKAMLRTAIRPKRKVVAGRTLRNGVARRGYRGVPVDDFRASFPLSGMTLSVVLGRTPWRAVRESYTDCREYMPLPPFVSPRPAEDVPAGCRSSAATEERDFQNCISPGGVCGAVRANRMIYFPKIPACELACPICGPKTAEHAYCGPPRAEASAKAPQCCGRMS